MHLIHNNYCAGRRRCCLALAFAAAFGSTARGIENETFESPTIQEIVAAIQAGRESVQSLRIHVSRHVLVEQGKHLPEPIYHGKVEFAFQGAKRYLRNELQNRGSVYVSSQSGSSVEMPIDDAIKRGFARATSVETRLLNESGFASIRGGVAELHTFESVQMSGASNFDEFYLRCAGWVVNDPTATKDFESIREKTALPGLLESGEMQFEITPDTTDDIPSIRIHGVNQDGSTRTLWLSPGHGYMLLQRDATDAAGRVLSQMRASDPVQITDRLWLPKRCTYSYDFETVNSAPRVGHMDDMQLIDWQVNSVSSSLFDINVPDSVAVVTHGKSAKPAVSFPPAGR